MKINEKSMKIIEKSLKAIKINKKMNENH